MNTPFVKKFTHATVSVDTKTVASGMVIIQQDSAIIAMLPEHVEALAKALLQADQYIKDRK